MSVSCPCNCGVILTPGRRCLRRRLEGRISTLTRRLDWQREQRCTKGFRTTWEARERLREQLAALPPIEHSSTTSPSVDPVSGTCILYVDKYGTMDA